MRGAPAVLLGQDTGILAPGARHSWVSDSSLRASPIQSAPAPGLWPPSPKPSPPGRREEREIAIAASHDGGRQQRYLDAGGRPWPHRRGARARLCDPRACAQHDRARHLFGHVERALLLQIVEDLAQDLADDRPAGDLRPRRECRGRRHRRRRRGRLQDREPQPPVLYRALPGGGDRGRRHPARRVHDGCQADRDPRFLALWRPRPPAHPPSSRRGRRRDRRLRQLRRRADGWRRVRVRRRL